MFSPVFTFIALAVICHSAITELATTCPCGWTNQPTTDVIGGENVGDHEYPFLATVYRKLGWKKEPICGATIISASKVITAAHCVDDTSSYLVLTGIADLSKAEPSDFIAVSDIATSGYDKKTNLNDIAVLTLAIPINFGSRNIGPVCIPKFGNNPRVLPTIVQIFGWAKDTHKLSGKLQKVDSKVANMEDCLKEYPLIDEKKQFCTYEAGKGPIKGDSGGPALWWDPEIKGYTLIGIVSMGPQDEATIPVVYTLVEFNPYLEFINKQTSGQICTKI